MAKAKAPEADIKDADEFMAYVNGAYGSPLVTTKKNRPLNKVPRFSSGVLSLDLALGGGWPFGRCSILAGRYSTGKTETATRAAIAVQDYDHHTKKPLSQVENGEPCRTLLVDLENAFDKEWLETKGLDLERSPILLPDSPNQAVDIVQEAILKNVFDLIIVDSIAAMCPIEEAEGSAEDMQMGVHARLVNKAYRKWVTAQSKVSTSGQISAAVIAINKLSEKIGFTMGDTRHLPHGQNQELASSVIIYMNGQQYDTSNKNASGMSIVSLKGNVQKNKTFTPRQNFSYDVALADIDEHNVRGSVDNVKALVTQAKAAEFIKKSPVAASKWSCLGKTFPTLKAITERLHADKELHDRLWRKIVKKETRCTWFDEDEKCSDNPNADNAPKATKTGRTGMRKVRRKKSPAE